MSPPKFIYKDLPLSAAPDALEGLINADLVPYGPASLVDISVTRPEDSYSRPRRSVLVTIRQGVSNLVCKVFGDGTPSGDLTEFDAYMATNPTHTPLRILDLAEPTIGRLSYGRTLVIFATTPWLGDPEPGRERLLIGQVVTAGGVQPASFDGLGKLIAYGTGSAQIIYGDNTTGPTVTVRNPTPNVAPFGFRHYVAPDTINGGFLIFPNCCDAA